MPRPKGQETSQQKQAGLITIDCHHRGKEKLRASWMREHPQQGEYALRLPPGMNRKVSHKGGCPRCQKGQDLRESRVIPQGSPPFHRKPPYCYPGCTITPHKIKSRATTYQKPNKFKGLGAEGNSLGPQ